MDSTTALKRLAEVLRGARKRRGLTQAQVAAMAGLPRLKVILVEKGQASVSAGAYAAVAAALNMEFSIVPARRPTLEEVPELLKHD
jgi:HTH-type transcriptional regulator/antitoxin HipB